MKKFIIMSILALILLGCEKQPVNLSPQQDYLDKVCKNPRPQICTREYIPVCGTVAAEVKTYGNACTACSDSNVSSYRTGACEKNTK